MSGQSTFDRKTGELINNFLARLPAPLCLVAHNGDLYNFPLLKAELEKAEITLLSNTLKRFSREGNGEANNKMLACQDQRRV
jgi:hypothetical protein